MFPLHRGTSARPEGRACDLACEVGTRDLGGSRPQDPAPETKQRDSGPKGSPCSPPSQGWDVEGVWFGISQTSIQILASRTASQETSGKSPSLYVSVRACGWWVDDALLEALSVGRWVEEIGPRPRAQGLAQGHPTNGSAPSPAPQALNACGTLQGGGLAVGRSPDAREAWGAVSAWPLTRRVILD